MRTFKFLVIGRNATHPIIANLNGGVSLETACRMLRLDFAGSCVEMVGEITVRLDSDADYVF